MKGDGRVSNEGARTRHSFGGDDHIYVELDEEMNLAANFKVMAITSTLTGRGIDGVIDICPANASYQVRFDPDAIEPMQLLAELESIEAEVGDGTGFDLRTTIVEVPVLYNDPWTRETLMRFRSHHQYPDGTDLEYAARINGFDSVEGFVAAHSGSPWFTSMVGFVAGLPFLFQMVPRERQLEVPKYLTPPDDRPRRLLRMHLLGAWRRRLPDVRHHARAHLRPDAEESRLRGLPGVLQAGIHRQVRAHRS